MTAWQTWEGERTTGGHRLLMLPADVHVSQSCLYLSSSLRAPSPCDVGQVLEVDQLSQQALYQLKQSKLTV